MSWVGKTAFITGASRGIGKAIALKLARAGANIVVAAKTTTPHPKLEGTIHTAVRDIEAAGGKGFAIELNIQDHDAIEKAMALAAQHFGGIDVLINNASAIALLPSDKVSVKAFDLMHSINSRGTFMCGKFAIPYLRESAKRGNNPSILNISPPLNLNPHWFEHHTAYTIAKYNMSLCVLGWAKELEGEVRANALWPRSTIATAAVRNLLGGQALVEKSRTPDIMAEAAWLILNGKDTGRFEIDDAVLLRNGATAADLEKFNVTPGGDLAPDFFLDDADEILASLQKGVVPPKAKL